MIAAPRRDPAVTGMLGVLGVWLVVCAVQLAMHRPAIAAGTMSDGDDYMRLLQVRDWIAGQSWWDVGQHRMNPAVGGLMHWSRLVDLPIALGLVVLTPLLGARAAEAATVAVVPLATLGLIVAVMAQLARRLFASAAAPPIAALLIAVSGFVTMQTFPTRIDHHGWQILLAAVTLAALIGVAPLRSGVVAGVALAAWLNISIEGLPFAVAACAAAALRWLIAPREEGARFTATLAALAGGSALLFVGTHEAGTWTMRWCDAVTPAHILTFAAAAAGAGCLVRFASGRSWAVRAASLALLGLGCGAAFVAMAPGCAANPFGSLVPVVHDVWYMNVLEGLPVWRQAPMVAVHLVFFPVVGLIGARMALRTAATAEERRTWATILLLIAGSFALALLLRRSAGVAHVIAVPGALAIIEPLRARAARFAGPAARALGAVAAVCVPSPLTPIYAGAFLPKEPVVAAPAGGASDARCSLAAVAALPPATILTTIDAGPPLLAFTHHKILAAGYHRNDRAMADLIGAFTADAAAAHAIVRRHRIGYVLIDPRSSEAVLYRSLAPTGLMARLGRGQAPSWLAPVPAGRGGLRLWRVVG